MQSRKGSLFEVCCNVGSGVITAYLTWKFVVIPQVNVFGWDLHNMNASQIVFINAWFTVTSVIRGYLWRRFFNRRII